ncbi:MAG: family 10 glycosylhydrolase [Fimbriimonadaceae bacterium]
MNTNRWNFAVLTRAIACGWAGWSMVAAASAQPITAQLGDPPPVPREMRGVWVATVFNIDWPTASNLTTATQQSQARTILDRVRDANMNAIFLQVRPSADAFYNSPREPWSEFLTGLMGRAPNPAYDPLAYWISEARKRNIEVHAWINPYRARVANRTTPAAANHVTNTHPHIVRDYNGMKWLDPGHADTIAYTLAAIDDIVNRYDVDGIVLDDYFYPYPDSNQTPFPDSATYAAYLASGGTLTLANWRRDNVNRFVEQAYTTVKSIKPWVRFGISPFGIWRPGNPPGIVGLDAYASIYADSRLWLNRGWVDYFSPQLYWRINATGQSYPRLLEWWVQENTFGRHIWPSNFTSKVADGSSSAWPAQEILDQIDRTRAQSGATGNVHYSMRAIRENRDSIATRLRAGPYAQRALVPASTWLATGTLNRPPIGVRHTRRNMTVFLRPSIPANEVRGWVVHTLYGSTWTTEILPADTGWVTRNHTGPGGRLRAVDVSVVDRVNRESPRSRAVPFRN